MSLPANAWPLKGFNRCRMIKYNNHLVANLPKTRLKHVAWTYLYRIAKAPWFYLVDQRLSLRTFCLRQAVSKDHWQHRWQTQSLDESHVIRSQIDWVAWFVRFLTPECGQFLQVVIFGYKPTHFFEALLGRGLPCDGRVSAGDLVPVDVRHPCEEPCSELVHITVTIKGSVSSARRTFQSLTHWLNRWAAQNSARMLRDP